MKVVDTHHHLWSVKTGNYQWLLAREEERLWGKPADIPSEYLVEELLADAGDLPGLGPKERAIIRVARELVNEPKLSAEAFREAQELFGNEGVMDLAGLVGYYTFVNYTIKTFDVQRPLGSQLLLPVP